MDPKSLEIDIPLELHDMSSFTHAKEFGRDLAKKILSVCLHNEKGKKGFNTDLLTQYFDMLLEYVDSKEDLDKCIAAVQAEIDHITSKHREEKARLANKAKRKGRLNLSDKYDMDDDSCEKDSEDEPVKEEHPDENQEETPAETIEEKFVELDMSELNKRAEAERVAREKAEEERRAQEEAQLKWQKERADAQEALLSRQRQVTTEIPEGFQIVSKSKQKGKGKR